MKRPTISIVVHTYGRAEYLKALITSIKTSTPKDVYEILVVSSDPPETKKVKWLQQQDIILILADVRREWQLRKQSAYYYMNLGLKRAQYEWAVVVNDDMCFGKDWYREFMNVVSDPHHSNVGMIVGTMHLGKVKHGRRLVKVGKIKKEGRDWKDFYLADLAFIRKDTLEEIGFYDEKIDWAGGGVDLALAVEFLTNKDTIISENIKVDHFIAEENRSKTFGNEFTGFNYVLNKWNKWCKENNCQFTGWDPGVKSYTLVNRLEDYARQKIRRVRHYARHAAALTRKRR